MPSDKPNVFRACDDGFFVWYSSPQDDDGTRVSHR